MNISLFLFVPENVIPRDGFGSFLAGVSLRMEMSRLNLVITYGIPPEFRGGVHSFVYNSHTPSVQSRVYRVTHLRTDGVHCRVSAVTGPVDLKVVPNECCLSRSPWTN